ncbi:SusC/RagA family TonB-linked outer membrane protein [Chitinophaga lutea]
MKHIISILLLSFLAVSAMAQGRKVTGTVSDPEGPVPFATVKEAGDPRNGVLTDDKGVFTITLRTGGDQLIVSSVGYAPKTISVKGKNSIAIQLESTVMGLGEVVTVGYAPQKKATNTGAVSMVTGKELRQSPAASLQNSLVGRLPGLFQQQTSGQPGKDGAAFYIRGQSTYNGGGNQPLIIVDDIEYSYDQVNQIDPNEVESVAILKDASTTAIYGIKGANGVLVITTRRGKQGPPKITFRSETGLQQPTVYRKPLPSHEAIPLLIEHYTNSNQNPELFLPGYTSPEAIEHFRLGDEPYKYPNVNWYDEVMKNNTIQQRNNLDINGGTENVRYFVSLGYIFQNGIMKEVPKEDKFNSNYYLKRYNFRSNLDVDVTRDLSLRLDLSARISEINEPNFPDVMAGGAWPFWRRITSGLLAPWVYPVKNPDGSYGGRKDFTLNPVGILQYAGYKRENHNDLNINLTANHKLDFITEGLSARATLAFTNDLEQRRSLTRGQFPVFEYIAGSDSYQAVNPNLTRIPLLAADGTWEGGRDAPLRVLNPQLMLNYRRAFNNHTVYALGLFNQQTRIRGANVPENFRGYSARLGYDFKSKYMFEFNYGYNGTDRFKAKKRYGSFPALSAGWNISEEPFFKENVRFVDHLKIRGSYGEVGNDKFPNSFQYLYEEIYEKPANQNYNFGETPNSSIVIAPGALANEDVRWERERKIDVGIELKAFKGKLEIVADYFDNYRYDILTVRGTVPSFSGITLPPVNLGEVSNKGVEVEMTHRNRINKLDYFLKGNISFAKNKVLYRDEPVNAANPLLAQTGRPIGQIYGYTFEGFYYDDADIEKSPKVEGKLVKPGDIKFRDINGDGVINTNDIGPIGFPNVPQVTYGVSAGFSWKGLDFSMLWQGATRGSIDASTMLQIGNSNGIPSEIHKKRWTPETRDVAEYPRLGGVNFDMSTFWLRPNDYLRLKNLELGYRIPTHISRRVGVQDIRLYANGLNLITWFNMKIYDVDPESPRGGALTEAYTNYPQQKIYNFGLQVSLK